MSVISKLEKDKKGFESGYVYIKDAVAYWSVVYEPKKKLKSEEREYAITLFVDSKDREILEEKLLLNKTFFEVGVDKNKFKKIKFVTSDQTDDEDVFTYDEVKGLHGAQFTCPEFSKKGNENNIAVFGPYGEKFSEEIGNGSKVIVKLFCYRNQDGLLNTILKAVRVTEHVPFKAGGEGSGEYYDDVMGVTIGAAPAKDEFGDVEEKSEDMPWDEDEDDLY